MLRFSLIFLLIFNCSTGVWAKQGGVAFDGSIGLPSIELSNPDGTAAAYDGLSLQGRLLSPIFEDSGIGIFLQGVLKYHDLENTISKSGSVEIANHIGPGVGLSFQFARLSLGYEYMMMKARHYYIGAAGRSIEFDYTVGSMYAGISVPFGALALGLSYGYAVGKILKAETGLSKDSDYTEQTIWFHLTYGTGAKLGDLAKSLVKK